MSGVRYWINEERTVLVTMFPSGAMTVALRDNISAIWGPPITVVEET